MNETGVGRLFLRNLIISDAAIVALIGSRVYWNIAPRNAAYPHVILSLQGGNNLEVLTGERLAQEPRYLIKVVDQAGDAEVSGRIAGMIDRFISGKQGQQILDGFTYWVSGVTQETPVDFTDSQGDTLYQHTGGIYRLFVEGVS